VWQALVPILGQQEQKEAQTNDGHGNDAYTVELDLTHVAIYDWSADDSWWSLGCYVKKFE